MRRAILAPLLLVACEGNPGPTPAEYDGVLQRLDAMEERLDTLENAADARAQDAVVAVAVPEPSPSADGHSSPDLQDPFAPPSAEPPTIRLTVTDAGIEIDGKRRTKTEAKALLTAAAKEIPKPHLIVLTQPEATHGQAVEVIDMAREAGISKFAIQATVHGPP